MLVYMIIFSLVTVSVLFESATISKSNKELKPTITASFFHIIVVTVLLLSSGTRLIGGTDYYWYKNAYKQTLPIPDFCIYPQFIKWRWFTSTLDYGYLLICAFFKYLKVSFYGFCMIEALFFYFAMYFGLRKYCNNFSIILLFFIAKIYFYETFISMRQSITIAIFFLSLPLIENKKFVRYFLVCIVCFYIHAGSIIMFPTYFISYIKVSKTRFKLWIILFLPFAVCNFFNINALQLFAPIIINLLGLASDLWSSKAAAYLSGSSHGLSPFYTLEYLMLSLLLYCNYDKCVDNKYKFDFVVKLYMVLWPLYSLFGGVDIITREKDYYILSYGLICSYLSHVSLRKYRYAFIIGSVIICGYEFFRFIRLFDNGGMIPYKSWLIDYIVFLRDNWRNN